ncbi:MAG: alpha/beta hydrolase family esterase [Caulobacter sp.]
MFRSEIGFWSGGRRAGALLAVLACFGAMLGWAGVAEAAGRCAIGVAGQTERVAVGNTGRSVLLHLPAGFDPARPAPVVFLFHGSTGDGQRMLAASRLAEASDRHGFIVVAPDGGIPVQGGFVWNIPGVPTVAGAVPGPQDADDVAFVGAAIDWLVEAGCADGARVYATGLSGGGRMTSWLGCVSSDRFAAIAPVVGLRAGNPLAEEPGRPDPATCRPDRPMPVIAFAGDADTVNPIEGGGAGYWQYTMQAAEQRWAQLNGCTDPPTTSWVKAGLYEERYVGCRDGAEVVGRITVGGGHVWLADNDAMWAFLSRFRREPPSR